MYNIFAWKIEKLLNTIFQRKLFFPASFVFLLLSNNTLHVMLYTSICYWNTFQYKYNNLIIQLTLKYIFLLFIILFLCLFLFCLDLFLFYEALLFPRCLIDLVYSYN